MHPDPEAWSYTGSKYMTLFIPTFFQWHRTPNKWGKCQSGRPEAFFSSVLIIICRQKYNKATIFFQNPKNQLKTYTTLCIKIALPSLIVIIYFKNHVVVIQDLQPFHFPAKLVHKTLPLFATKIMAHNQATIYFDVIFIFFSFLLRHDVPMPSAKFSFLCSPTTQS